MVSVTAKRAGRDRSVTYPNMTVNRLTAPDTGNASKDPASVSSDGKDRYVMKVINHFNCCCFIVKFPADCVYIYTYIYIYFISPLFDYFQWTVSIPRVATTALASTGNATARPDGKVLTARHSTNRSTSVCPHVRNMELTIWKQGLANVNHFGRDPTARKVVPFATFLSEGIWP